MRSRPLVRFALCAALLLGWWLASCDLRAQSITLQSGTLGATGHLGGTSVTTAQFVGWRFEIDTPLIVEQVGGHLAGYPPDGNIFAAIVSLQAIDAFPAGAPFTEEEVVATTTFAPPFPSDDVRTPLAASLSPGSYALVFGTGMFGATGEGAVVNAIDQDDIPPTTISSFIFWGIPNPSEPPLWRTNLASHMHVVIEGRVPAAADFNEDGDVDGDDLALWSSGFATASPATHGDGDADADQDVDGADFLAWQRELTSGSGGVLPVPEPAAWALAWVATFFCAKAASARSPWTRLVA